MLYSYEQGIKIAVSELLRALLDMEIQDKKVEF